MKLKKSIRWLAITGLAVFLSFIWVMLLSAFISLNEAKTEIDEGNDDIEDHKPMEKEDYDSDLKTITKKDTEMGIVVPEYSSFEEYVSNMAKDFNGETERIDKTTTENFKYHLVVTSTNYLKYYDESGEVPGELQQLVNDGIKVTDGFENADDPDQYFSELKKIHNELDKNITYH